MLHSTHHGKHTNSSRPSFCTHFCTAFRHQHTSRQPRKQKTIYWFKNAATAGESSRPRIKQKHIDLNSSTLITRRIHTTNKQEGNTLSSPPPLRRLADGYHCVHPYQLTRYTLCYATGTFITVIKKHQNKHITNKLRLLQIFIACEIEVSIYPSADHNNSTLNGLQIFNSHHTKTQVCLH